MKSFSILFTLLALANPVFAVDATASKKGDDCTLNFESITALINSKSDQLSHYGSIAKDSTAKIQIETAVLSNGVMVVSTSGGCAHLGQSLSYSAPSIKSDKQAVETAIKYLKATPATGYGNSVKITWVSALENWLKSPTSSNFKVINLGKGDATITLNYDVMGLLKIDYSFAL